MAPAPNLAHQSFSIASPDGPVQFTTDDLAFWLQYAARICINYGTQIGASAAILIVQLLVTKAKKRRSAVFILNSVSLVLNFIRLVLGCLYYTGPFYAPYVYFTADFSVVPTSAKATSIATNVMTWLLLICVETSLVFQIHVVCAVNREAQRFWLTSVAACVAMLPVALRLASVVLTSKSTLDLDTNIDIEWLNSGVNISTTISICFFCLVFLYKLGWAVRQRHKLGLTQFGPMQAIFIMGCQTLIIPAIFGVFQYVGEAVQLQSLVLTTVVLFLPLSSLWAAAQIGERPEHSLPNHQSGKKSLLDSYGSGSMVTGGKGDCARKGSQYTESEPRTPMHTKEMV